MKIIGFIERNQTAVVEKILKHCGLWKEVSARPPPELVPEKVEDTVLDYGFFAEAVC